MPGQIKTDNRCQKAIRRKRGREQGGEERQRNGVGHEEQR